MGYRRRRYRASLGLVFDVAVQPIDQSSEQRAHEQREQCPILDGDIGGQREQIESNVLVIKRIVRAVRHLIKELQKNAPVPDLPRGDQQGDKSGAACNGDGPRQPIAHEFERIGWRRSGSELPVEAGGNSPPPGKAECKPRIRPHDDGSCDEDDEKNAGFGADRGPKDLQIADRGEPHPVDQEVTGEAEQDQENSEDDGSNEQPYHGVSPWCLPFGSGNPDRHD